MNPDMRAVMLERLPKWMVQDVKKVAAMVRRAEHQRDIGVLEDWELIDYFILLHLTIAEGRLRQ